MPSKGLYSSHGLDMKCEVRLTLNPQLEPSDCRQAYSLRDLVTIARLPWLRLVDRTAMITCGPMTDQIVSRHQKRTDLHNEDGISARTDTPA